MLSNNWILEFVPSFIVDIKKEGTSTKIAGSLFISLTNNPVKGYLL